MLIPFMVSQHVTAVAKQKWFTAKTSTLLGLTLVKHTKSNDHNWVNALGNKVMRNTSGGAYRALGAEKDMERCAVD